MRGLIITTALLMMLLTPPAFAKTSIVDTLHNLSITGPGEFKSENVDRVCIFCHTPHIASPEPGLWNRNKRPTRQSLTKDSESPSRKISRSSDLCLSCHDGTVALGDVINQPRGKSSRSNDLRQVFLTGRSKFDPELKNHHSVGILYDHQQYPGVPSLVTADSINLPLEDGELQCITCHDAHASTYPPFLHNSTKGGELCLACHLQQGINWDWQYSSHAQSTATPRGQDPWKERKQAWKGKTVAENACMNCHLPHNAESNRALTNDKEEKICFRCHNSSVANTNIKPQMQKFSKHPIDSQSSSLHISGRNEDPFDTQLHSVCGDCHNPHASQPDQPMISFNPTAPLSADHSTAPFANGSILGVTGIDISGNKKDEIEFEFELCFKCHGVPGRSSCDNFRCSTAERYEMQRQDEIYNLREKVDSSNPNLQSYHPIDTNNPDNNDEVPSLRVGIPINKSSSRIYCSDCHSGDSSPAAGGSSPTGTHGSRHEGLLALRYEFNPSNNASSANNTLCFKCHEPGNLYANESFLHRQHVVENNTACINCHDPHGSTVYPHLINFLVSSSYTGQKLEITGTGSSTQPTWEDNGRYSGTCYLNCHGVVHDGWSYPANPLSTIRFK